MGRAECESIRPLISAYVDGELDSSESSQLHQHVAHCEQCRALLNEYSAIREYFRSNPSTPPPPPDLADRIRSKTVDKPPSPRWIQWLHTAGAELGFSAAVAAFVLLIAGAFFLVRGYQQGVQPAVVGSAPTEAAEWPIFRPVEIKFNKPMDHQSVIEHLRIWPKGEADRLPVSWKGNTLVIGANAAESAVLSPNTTYYIMIHPDARDAWGNRLGEQWVLSFRSAPTEASQATPTPTPISGVANTEANKPSQQPATPTPTPAPTATATPTKVPERPAHEVVPAPEPTPTATAPVRSEPTPTSTPSPTPSPTATATSPSATATATATPSATSPTTTSTPTPGQTPAPSPSPTSETTPTAEPTPTGTGTPSDTSATPSPSETPPGTPEASPEPIPVTGAFGAVYWGHEDIQAQIGEPLAPEVVFNAMELGFQRGAMYERFDNSTIYVMFDDGTWTSVDDTWTSADGEYGGPGPEQNLWIPPRNFGKVWAEDDSLAERIGYAISPESHLMQEGGRAQRFANGTMLYSDQGFVYVLFDDGQWQLFQDTSGQTDLMTPTAEPSGTAAPDSVSTPEDASTSATSTPTAAVTPEPTPFPTSTE